MTTTSEQVELLPCPFCGGEAWLFKHSSAYTDEYSVRCASEGCCEVNAEFEVEATTAWNTRTQSQPSSDAPTGDVERLVERAIEAWHDSDKSLHEWLGWTKQEFSAWVADPTAIPRVPKHYAVLAQPTDTREAVIEVLFPFARAADLLDKIAGEHPLPEGAEMVRESASLPTRPLYAARDLYRKLTEEAKS